MFNCKNCGEKVYDYDKEELGNLVCDDCYKKNPCYHYSWTAKKIGELDGYLITQDTCNCGQDLGKTITIGYRQYGYDPKENDRFRKLIVEHIAFEKKYYEENKDDPLFGVSIRKKYGPKYDAEHYSENPIFPSKKKSELSRFIKIATKESD